MENNMSDQVTHADRSGGKQISNRALQEMARPYAKAALETVFRLLTEGDNDNVKLGAAKIILSKVLPDLKATELTGAGGSSFTINVIEDTTLKDANESPAGD
jgi:hypothetical protein